MKNNSFKYSENKHSDEFEDVVDLDSGEEVEPRFQKVSPDYWPFLKQIEHIRSEMRGTAFKFPNVGKQIKALAELRALGVNRKHIEQKWREMEGNDYWFKRGFDLRDLVNEYAKKPF